MLIVLSRLLGGAEERERKKGEGGREIGGRGRERDTESIQGMAHFGKSK